MQKPAEDFLKNMEVKMCTHKAREEFWLSKGKIGVRCVVCGEVLQPTVQSPKPTPDIFGISSGLGIGGYGSDDHNSRMEPNDVAHIHGEHCKGQLWEPCPVCGTEPVRLCGYCKKHCKG